MRAVEPSVSVSAHASRKAIPGRLPSRREFAQAFLACLFPIQLWAILVVLNEVPAWILQMSLWDVVGVVSYTQALALFEAVIVIALLVLIAAVFPARLFRQRFVAVATGIVYLAAAWFVLAHVNDKALHALGLSRYLVPWVGLFFLTELLLAVAILRSSRLESAIMSFVDRISVLSGVYFVVALVGVIIVLIRNI